MKYIWVLVILFGTVSCATSNIVYNSEGEVSHLIDCSGTALNWSYCQEKASEICGTRGYVVIDQGGSRGTMALPDGYGGVNYFPTETRTVMIQCK